MLVPKSGCLPGENLKRGEKGEVRGRPLQFGSWQVVRKGTDVRALPLQDKLISTFDHLVMYSVQRIRTTFYSLMVVSLWQLPAQGRHSECTLQGQGRASQERCSDPVLTSTIGCLLSVTFSTSIIYHKLLAPHTPHTCFIAGFLIPSKNRRRAHELALPSPGQSTKLHTTNSGFWNFLT